MLLSLDSQLENALQQTMFQYRHQVQFYETDMMGIVHHSNYLRFYEEARVAYAHHLGVLDYQKPESAAQFAVLETRVKHLKPVQFGETVSIEVQAKVLKNRIIFQYQLSSNGIIKSVSETQHVSLGEGLRLERLSPELKEKIGRSPWNETWLLNL